MHIGDKPRMSCYQDRCHPARQPVTKQKVAWLLQQQKEKAIIHAYIPSQLVDVAESEGDL